jgi:hypothetical protein
MSRLIPAAERIAKARALIQKARDYPVPPEEAGRNDFSYVAQVKDIMRQARDLIKFISYTPSASPEMKREVAELFKEIDVVQDEILHGTG